MVTSPNQDSSAWLLGPKRWLEPWVTRRHGRRYLRLWRLFSSTFSLETGRGATITPHKLHLPHLWSPKEPTSPCLKPWAAPIEAIEAIYRQKSNFEHIITESFWLPSKLIPHSPENADEICVHCCNFQALRRLHTFRSILGVYSNYFSIGCFFLVSSFESEHVIFLSGEWGVQVVLVAGNSLDWIS